MLRSAERRCGSGHECMRSMSTKQGTRAGRVESSIAGVHAT
jgi:hypothetical protein